jgi:hypothetical protein
MVIAISFRIKFGKANSRRGNARKPKKNSYSDSKRIFANSTRKSKRNTLTSIKKKWKKESSYV